MKKITFLFVFSMINTSLFSQATSKQEEISFSDSRSASIMRIVPTQEAIDKFKNPMETDATLTKILNSLKLDLNNIDEDKKVTIFKRYYILNKEELLKNNIDTTEDKVIFSKNQLTIYSDIYMNERSQKAPFVKKIASNNTTNVKVIDPNFTYTMKDYNGSKAMVAYTIRVGKNVKKEDETNAFLQLNAFPNPSDGSFTVSIKNYSLLENPTLMVSNIEGKVVYQKELDAQNISDNSFPVTLDANLAAGQYFVVLMNSKQLETLPILIQR